MIIDKMHKVEFKKLCQQHGKKINECMDCVVTKDGVIWSIDVEHKAYPAFIEITTESPIDQVTTTQSPSTDFTYSFYNRKYSKE